ncbi:MAG: DNA gyrase C-terminal beta-propeller domain-containing protein, partial [Asticcacaulis sp.]
KFKEGDSLGFLIPAETTDKLLILASDGRFLTLGCDKLPGGRGHGEPLRLMLDLDEQARIIDVFAHVPGRKRLMASRLGYGFVLPEDEAVASKRAGKQVLNVDGTEALPSVVIDGDHLAVWGENNKCLIFPVSELPEMAKGKGVKLQNYKDGGLKDMAVFAAVKGAVWYDTQGRQKAWGDWKDYLGRRASVGRNAPRGLRKLRP